MLGIDTKRLDCRDVHALLARSGDAEAAIDANIQELTQLVSKLPADDKHTGSGLAQAIMQTCESLRVQLVARGASLGVLASAALVCLAFDLSCDGLLYTRGGPCAQHSVLASNILAPGMQVVEPMVWEVSAAGRGAPLPDLTPPPMDAKGKGKASVKEATSKSSGEKSDSSKQQVPGLATATGAVLSSAESAAEAACKSFYSGERDPKRPLTRPEQIPEQQEALVDRIKETLRELDGAVKSHVAAAASKLRAQVCCACWRGVALDCSSLYARLLLYCRCHGKSAW